MKAVITVIGRDTVGIIAAVSGYLAENGINILNISQTIMEDIFTMIMMVDTGSFSDYEALGKGLHDVGAKLGVDITMQNEKIFNSMHRI